MILRKKRKTGGIMLSNFKIYHKDTVINNSIVMALRCAYRPMKQNESPEISEKSILSVANLNSSCVST